MNVDINIRLKTWNIKNVFEEWFWSSKESNIKKMIIKRPKSQNKITKKSELKV